MQGHGSILRRSLDYPRFAAGQYTVALIDGGYFAVEDCRCALEHLGHRVFSIKPGPDFIQRLLYLFVEVRPDFLLTINHLGFDEEGKLAALLTELEMPFASWFVDSPAYILKNDCRQVSEWCKVFCWERSYLPMLEKMGFGSPVFLPLATNPATFRLRREREKFSGRVAFVGDSLTEAVRKYEARLPGGALPPEGAALVRRQLEGGRRPMADMVRQQWPDIPPPLSLDLDAALVWKATRQYRAGVVQGLLPLGIAVYGDEGWRELLPGYGNIHGPVHYFRELPLLYCGADVNVNATSFQMNGALNQRVFDCAAAGAFLLTDHQEDMDIFFDVGLDAVCYRTPEEAVELAAWYLGHEAARREVTGRARARVLADHTYERRMQVLVSGMKMTFLRRSVC